MILVLSHAADPHAARVLDHLRRDGVPARLLDLSALPGKARVTLDFRDGAYRHGAFSLEGEGPIDLREVTSAWWRRPQAPALATIADPDVLAFTHNEWQEALQGIWQLTRPPH